MLLTKEECSVESIKAMLDQAFFTCEIDAEGDLRVMDRYRVRVTSNSTFITLTSAFGAKNGVSKAALHEACNFVNSDQKIPRVWTTGNSEVQFILFDLAIPIGEGLTPRTLVETLRLFQSSIEQATPVFDDLVE